MFFQASAAFGANLPKIDCESTQAELNIVHTHMERIYEENGNPYEEFKQRVEAQFEYHQLNSLETKPTTVEQLPKINYENLASLPGACGDYAKDLENEELKKPCDELLLKYVSDENYKKELDKTLEDDLKLRSDKIIEIQKDEHFATLKSYEQFLAHNLLSSENCLKEEGQREAVLEIACGRSFEGFPSEGVGDLVKSNMEVILKLNQDLTKPDLHAIVKTCAKLKGDETLNPEKVNLGYQEDFPFCQVILTNYKKDIKDAEKEKNKKEKKEKRKARKSLKRYKKVDEIKNPKKDYSQYAGHWSTEKYYKKKKKRGKFWKTAGTVAAAVGISGLIGWGLYSLFKPASKSSYTPPTPSTEPRTYYNYSMDPYQMYQYQQYQMNGWYNSDYYQNNYMNYYYNYDPNMTVNNYDTFGANGGANSQTGYTPYSFSFTP